MAERRTSEKPDEQPKAPGADEVQEKVDAEEEKGFRGVEVDPVDNHNYTVAGVTSGAPTPETDPEMARKVRADLDSR